MATSRIEIPSMKNCPNYSHWKELIEVWVAVTSVAKAKQADSLLLTLDSDAQSLALQVPAAERKAEDGSGVSKIIEKLDTLYEQNATQRLFCAYEDFEGFKRTQDMSLAKFISEFEMKSKVLANLKVVLPESLLAFKLLKNANLGDECARIVRVAINTSAPTDVSKLTLAAMKATILNAFDVRLETDQGASSSSQGIGRPFTEPFTVKPEPLDVYQTRSEPRRNSFGEQQHTPYQRKFKSSSSWRDTVRNRPDYKKNVREQSYQDKENHSPAGGYRVNRVDKTTGKPSQCKLCGSIYHWARQCPQYQKQMDDAVLEAQSIDVNLLAHSMEHSL